MKTTHGRSRTRFSAVRAMKATEAHSLSFGDLSPNDHEGASLNDQHHDRISPTLLRGSARESYESGFSTGRSQTGTDTRFVVKASESASCHSPPGARPDTEAARICFVVLTTKQTNLASCQPPLRLTKETNLASCPPPLRLTKETNPASTAVLLS